MSDNLNDDRPIFLQIAEMLEGAILNGAYGEDDQIPSITELSVAYTINPATALKGVNLLVEQGLLYKKRGLGMFVAKGARRQLAAARRESFFAGYVEPLVSEARRLGMEEEAVTALIKRGFEGNGH